MGEIDARVPGDRGRQIEGSPPVRARRALAGVLVLSSLCGVAPVRAAGSCAGASVFSGPGMHAIGARTYTLVDTNRPTPANGTFPGAPERTLVLELWYPATTSGRDAPLDQTGGPYPLVLYSHALNDTRLGEEYLTTHLASRGYVVAAVDFPLGKGGAPGGATPADLRSQPGDLTFVLDWLLARNAEAGHALDGAVDAERIGASGLSLGATTTLLAAYHPDLREPRLRAILPIAPPYSCAMTTRFFDTATLPLLLLHGTGDRLVPIAPNSEAVLRRAHGPRFLVRVERGSHLGFVGFATALGPTVRADDFGCTALKASLGANLDGIPLPGGAAAGIAAPTRHCPAPCRRPAGAHVIDAARQHAVAQTVVAAFFDAYLRDDEGARCFLRRRLDREVPGVEVERRG
jgi:predicted dienelactone hydrolase